MSMIDIIPSILVRSKQEFLAQLEGLDHSVPHLQLDIADGKLVPNTTWAEPGVVQQAASYTFELHLMVESPLEVIAEWKDISNVKRFIIHVESVDSLTNTILHIRTSEKFKREIFVALNPETSLEKIKTAKDVIDGVLFMGVTPGFQGQKLIPHVLKKIVQCRTQYPDIYTELDGGVHEDTLVEIAQTGVHAICPGSLVFHRENTPYEQILFIQKSLV